MRIRKRLLYYILGVAAIFVLSLTGPLCVVGNDGGTISVLTGIVRLPRKALGEFTVDTVFSACTSQWMYTLMPLAVSIPSASFINDELKSRFYMGAELRMGKYRYIYSRYLYSAVSGAATVLSGLILYAVMVACIFPWSAAYAETGMETGTGEILLSIFLIMLYMALYGMAMSVMGSFLVYLYPNLYVNLSLLFILSYILRWTAMREYMLFPVIMIAGMAGLYGFMWRIRSEKI